MFTVGTKSPKAGCDPIFVQLGDFINLEKGL